LVIAETSDYLLTFFMSHFLKQLCSSSFEPVVVC